jgi:uncharacterized protein YodC (DUF2158 family)
MIIELGTLVRGKSGAMGIVTEIHDSGHSKSYRIKWFNGKMGVVLARQFEVIA